MRRPFSTALAVLGGGGAAGVAALGWATVEARAFRVRHVDVPVLAPGARPLRLLHVSDLHMTPDQGKKQAWVRSLADLEPDLVVDTGDNLAHVDAVPAVLDALAPLLQRPGIFVMGSNDYYRPTLKNPVRYLLPDRGVRIHAGPLPVEDLRRGLTAGGWLDLGNARRHLEVGGLSVELVGTEDAHIRRDRYSAVGGPADASADLSLGITHAPYRRVLDPMTRDGLGLILAGHTHGGQVCVPGVGALVTNCDLSTRLAKGLSTYTHDGREALLHVSAGVGTSPYAPVRFACPPEATLLTLVERQPPSLG